MRMFLDGVAGGKPADGVFGQQPEWFYKGDGRSLVDPGDTLTSPAFAQDGGEEPELAGIYLIGADGTPWRLGVALANEFSDHLTERHNYLWLAHSKLRQAALGAELRRGDPPTDIQGISRIVRDGAILWERPFLTGEDYVASPPQPEHHHFNMRASTGPATCTFTSSARRPCRSPAVSRPWQGIYLRSWRRRSRCRCATGGDR